MKKKELKKNENKKTKVKKTETKKKTSNKKFLFIICTIIVFVSVFALGRVSTKLDFKESKEKEIVKEKYTITFDSDGGTTIEEQIVEEGNVVTKPSDPSKEKYIFVEWQLDGGTYDFSAKVKQNITLKAIWQKIKENQKTFIIKFDSNGGSSVSSKTVIEGEKVSKPSNPTKKGYKFMGWYLNNEKVVFPLTVKNNVTLKAKWEKIEITSSNTSDNTITYYCDDGWTLNGDICLTSVDATKECDTNFKEYGEECISVNGEEPTLFCSTRMLPTAYGWEPSAKAGYLATDSMCYYNYKGDHESNCYSRGEYFIDNRCYSYRFTVEKKCDTGKKLILIDGNEMCYKTKEYSFICNNGLLNGQKCIITKKALYK